MFVFDVTSIISYDDYLTFITSLKEKFNSEKCNLFHTYKIYDNGKWPCTNDVYFEFRDKYRALRQRLVESVLNKFRGYLPSKCLIYEFGSLTKLTDRIESDTDLTICYDDSKQELYESVEELINYSIVNVLEHSIDHIHGKFQHYPMVYDYENLQESDNIYVLKFDKGIIKYKCGPETLSENLMNIKNVRDYGSLIDGYKEKYSLHCNIDCLYSIQILENSTAHDFIGDLANLENNNDIFDNYKYIHRLYYFDKEIEISYIKKSFKDTIVDMYTMIAYTRKRVNWLNHYSMTMDDVFKSAELERLFGKEYIKVLKESFIKMIFYWDKIELLLKNNNILLSTRCHKRFSKKELNNMLYKAYGELDLMDTILSSINELNIIIEKGWIIVNEKNN